MKKILPKEIKEIAQIIKDHGGEVYLVGGVSRDFLLGKKEFKDFDLITSLDNDTLVKIFNKKIVGNSFGVIKLKFKDLDVDIASFRKESDYDGRRPGIIQPGTLLEDVSRRDFTINAIVYDLINYRIMDLVKGAFDLENKVLRAIGNPDDRFKDDYLRILRAIRFMITLNFTLDKELEDSIKKNIHKIKKLSKERIKMETDKILSSKNFYRYLDSLEYLGFFSAVFNQESDLIIKKIGIMKIPNNLIFYSQVFDENQMVEFGLSNQEKRSALAYKKVIDDIINFDEISTTKKNQLITNPSYLEIEHSLNLSQSFVDYRARYHSNPIDLSLKTTGKELIAMGMEKSPEIGRIIQEFNELVYSRAISAANRSNILKELLTNVKKVPKIEE